MAVDQGRGAVAPAKPSIRIPITPLGLGSERWARISRMGPNYYSTHPGNRYSCAQIPDGVLYLSKNSSTCFWEVFWETFLSAGGELRVDKKKLIERTLYSGVLKRALTVFDATNPAHLHKIGANTVSCFNGEYTLCRGWAALIFNSDPKVDGILFPSARSGGRTNLALFGGRVRAADVEFEMPGVPLLEDPQISRLLIENSIGWL